jgi:sugar-specific transcriptional regulator TrmB
LLAAKFKCKNVPKEILGWAFWKEDVLLQDEEIKTFTGLGLTFLQAKVYLTLIRTGNSTIKMVAEQTGIARQEAQRVTAELQKIGLVEKILLKPTEFRPIHIKEAIMFLLERREKASLELKERANRLLQNLSNYQNRSLREESGTQFVIICGKEAIIRKSKSILNRTTKSCEIINGLWKNVGYAGSLFEKESIKMLKRNVKIRIVAEKLPEPQVVQEIYKHCATNSNFQIRFISPTPSAMLGMYDRRELLVSTSPEKLIGDSPMLWTNSSALILAVQTYFDKLWETSAPFLNRYSSRNINTVNSHVGK